jgi:phospholipid/cholesterol/gamma-HCH transport system substrate-binding protein
MQKQAPSLGRILVALGFTLSCFGLILFLWIAFGGPIPLKPESYRVTAYFPEATQLAVESDVRIGGVSVGKVKTIELAPEDARVDGLDTTEAEIEIEPEFAPISSDARAILRQKTLLGETYVELTSGTEPGEEGAPVSLGAASNVSDAEADSVESIPEGGTLGISRTENATQIDEIFNALDEQTREAFQRWQQNASVAIDGRGPDLNDALGNLGPFLTDATGVVDVLKRQDAALRGLVRDTGVVFEAISEHNSDLQTAIRGSHATFEAFANQREAVDRIFDQDGLPKFQRETTITLDRLDEFQADTRPLIQKLLPVANDISPTLDSVEDLAPSLKSLFVDLKPLIRVSREALPGTRDFLAELAPVLDALDPFLANLNPVVKYLQYYGTEIINFLTGPPAGLSGTLEQVPGQYTPRHALRQLSYLSAESLSVYPQRLDTNRGNGYLQPDLLNLDPRVAPIGMFPNFDCDNTGAPGDGEVLEGSVAFAPCFVSQDFPDEFGGGHAPNLFADP